MAQRAPAGPLIHIGLHRTGTTWLQRNVFACAEAGFSTPWGRLSRAAVEHFVTVDPLHFDAEQSRRYFQPQLDEAAQRRTVPVLTHEALSSRPHQGQYYAPQVARRLREVFPQGRVLIVVREQKALLSSLYRQYVRNGGTYTIEQFLGGGDEAIGWAPLCRLPFFEFDRLVAFYQELFGREGVLALPMELLKKDQEDFLARIATFAGVIGRLTVDAAPANVGWSGATLAVYRRLNRFLARNPLEPRQPRSQRYATRLFNKLDAWLPSSAHERAEQRLEAFVAERVGNRFADSNAKLASLLEMDLASLGYR